MQSENEHIKEFLRDYAKLNSPEYAVLIRGEWGAGKTWFVKEVFNLDNKDKKTLYVSVNGMSSIKDIENDFLTQLHPLLNHKNMRRAGRFLAGTLKATLKIDLNNDGVSDGTANINLPNEKLLESLNLSDDALLIFDDLERCSIPIPNLLGYINQFVEHEGLKVILIANEEEIDTNTKEYKRIKELKKSW